MMSLRIEVQADDIQQGQRENYYCCPIANAVRRAIESPGSTVVVGRHLASVFSGRFVRLGRLPEIATRFIDDFDLKRPVSPIAFDLTLEAA